MKKPIILGIYGRSNSGKTTLIKHLVEWLHSNGIQVATVKKTPQPYQLDEPGKDTYLHGLAGASPVVFSTPVETAFIIHQHQSEPDIVKTVQSFNPLDVIIIEGCHHPTYPKITMDAKGPQRENTVFSYDGDIQKVKKYLNDELAKRNNL